MPLAAWMARPASELKYRDAIGDWPATRVYELLHDARPEFVGDRFVPHATAALDLHAGPAPGPGRFDHDVCAESGEIGFATLLEAHPAFLALPGVANQVDADVRCETLDLAGHAAKRLPVQLRHMNNEIEVLPARTHRRPYRMPPKLSERGMLRP